MAVNKQAVQILPPAEGFLSSCTALVAITETAVWYTFTSSAASMQSSSSCTAVTTAQTA